jgi:hypothetical protein
MRKKNFIFLITLVLLIPLMGFSQPHNFYNLDYGLKLGVSNYIGDLGGYNTKAQPFVLDMKMQETRWSFGTYIRYRFGRPYTGRNLFMLEAQLNWIRIDGADSLTKNYLPRKLRNLNFRNNIIQLNMMADWIFYENPYLGHHSYIKKAINLYVCTGLSVFYQNPQTYNPSHFMGLPTWVSLHGLRTEAQLYNKPFHLIQPGIPIGTGLNYTFKRQYRIGWSITWTETFTDYLDGVSGNYPTQAEWNTLTPEEKYFSNRIISLAGADPSPNGIRGDPTNKDSFITTTFNVGYVIKYPKHDNYHYHKKKTQAKF